MTNALHNGQVARREKLVHKLNLLDADAVFAGDAAAAGDALLEYLAARRQGGMDLFRNALVEQYDGVNVAVAGVEHVDDADAVLR